MQVGRYLDKVWDWNAFPANDPYPELERAQMRYIGAGGSPKAADPSTFAPGAFTCSLIHQEPGRRASVHHHQIAELFFVHRGTLTMTWQFGDETVDFTAGPLDAILNPVGRPHGFRTDGPGECLMQIMVGTAAPMLPTYTDHPKDHATSPLRPADPTRASAYLEAVQPWLVRASATRPLAVGVDGGTFTAHPYVMAPAVGGLVAPQQFCFAVDRLSRGATTPAYALDVEEAFMVVDGVLDVEELDESGAVTARARCAPRDLAYVAAGARRRLVNRDAATAVFTSIVGSTTAGPIGWETALAVR